MLEPQEDAETLRRQVSACIKLASEAATIADRLRWLNIAQYWSQRARFEELRERHQLQSA